jgi:hypothetical protein
MIAPPYFEGDVIVLGFHGILGILLLIIIALQVILSLLIKDRRKIRKLHLISGYSLLIILSIQVFNGLYLITY